MWKRVNVSLPDPASDSNHYDNDDVDLKKKNNRKKAKGKTEKKTNNDARDLEASPYEGVGMFYSLEVLDGNDYQILSKDKHKQFVVLDKQDSSNGKTETNNNNKKKKKKKTKKKKRKQSGDEDETEGSSTAPTPDDTQKPGREPQQTKRRKKQHPNDSSEEAPLDKAVEKAASNTSTPSKSTAKSKLSGPKAKKREDQKAMAKDEASSSVSDATKSTAESQQEESKEGEEEEQQQQMQSMQTSWLTSTGGVALHLSLCKSLVQQGFWTPTPIQAATLPAAILGRRNIVGAAPTGSGKTLSYLLPILQHILEAEHRHRKAQALILAPTRELAIQVTQECHKLSQEVSVVTLVGGLAMPKQVRLLEKQKPPILVATPGRLWEMMSSRQHEHLNDLSQIRFLVIDEADRMVQQGSFPQLSRILEAVHEANPLDDESDEESLDGANDLDDYPDRLLGLPGIPGEAKVMMLGDVLDRIKQDQQNEERPDPVELTEDEYNVQMRMEENDDNDEDYDDDDSEGLLEMPSLPPVPRQTFVYSATLTLDPLASYSQKQLQRNAKRKTKLPKSVDGALAQILEKAHASGLTKVVDLTSDKKRTQKQGQQTTLEQQQQSSGVKLPPGLTLYTIKCTQKHKDSHLYAYLVTTSQGASGPCLVFCNSIAAVKRVGMTLQTLKLPVRMLHANMPQKARFKAMESLRSNKNRSIVVATDVAARGLDIPNVSTVIHYDVARTGSTFIHRAGRTARGIGEGAVGASLSLVAPAEEKAHDRICAALGGDTKQRFEVARLDSRLLSEAQERVLLACKIVACDTVESRVQKQNQWFADAAAEAGLELDDDLLEEGLVGGSQRERQQVFQAQRARADLKVLLTQPMRTQRFGKFLSTQSISAYKQIEPQVSENDTNQGQKTKKRKKQSRKRQRQQKKQNNVNHAD